MNIFFLDLNPTISAEALADVHVGKMCLEATQILSNAYHMPEATVPPPPTRAGAPYKASHYNHPCSVWARETAENYRWLFVHAWGLLNEYEYRFGKKHGCIEALSYIGKQHNWPTWIHSNKFWAPPRVMPAEYKVGKDYVFLAHDMVSISYKNYYRQAKAHLLKYTKRMPPTWLGGMMDWQTMVDELISKCDLVLVDADKHRPNGLTDEYWEAIKKMATNEINGRDAKDGVEGF